MFDPRPIWMGAALCILLAVPLPSLGQPAPAVIEGHVRTSDGDGIPYANVLVEGTTHGVATDRQGHFLLRVKTILNEGMNKGSVDSVRQARALFKQTTAGSKDQPLAHYYAALADYRLSTLLPQDAEEKREKVLVDATEHLTTATEIDDTSADAWALLTGVYGQRMGLNPMQAVSLSSDAEAAMERAKKLAPDNPRVWIIDGTQDFFTPSMFGGDKERALEKFQKAARLAEQETVEASLQPSWEHAEAYAWIGSAHMDPGRTEEARKAFEKALEINPDCGWV